MIEWGEFYGPVEHAAGVEVDVVCCLFNEDEADGKEGSEDDSHGGSAVDFSELGNPLGEEGGEDSGDGCTDKHGPAGAGVRDEEGDGESGEDGVADGISHHGHAPQEEEASGEGASHGA